MVKISLPPEKRVQFFVYIIESPSPADMYHNRFEGDMLKKALSLDKIASTHRIAVNKEAFEAAIKIGLIDEQMKVYSNLIPIIHISAHGSKDGIQLTDGQVITWSELKNLLLPVNRALNGTLMLCMSSCEGFHACRMAMSSEEELPFFAVVGNKGRPAWSDTAVAYAAFYHLIKKGCYVTDAVKAMREASGDDNFQEIRAQEARKAFIEEISSQQLIPNFQQRLQQNNKETPPSPEAKNLEKSS